MLKILLISEDETDQKRLMLLSRARGCQVDVLEPKEIPRVPLVKVRPYTIILVTGDLPWEFHVELSKSLWDVHPQGYYAVYTFSSKPIPSAGRLATLGVRVFGEDSIEEDFLALIDDALPRTPFDTSGIIIVDQIETPLRILESILQGLHFRCFTTGSGEQGWQQLYETPSKYFLLITEIASSDISGQELIKRIRGHQPIQQLPILVLSAHGTPKVLWDCLIEGASGFVVKPPKRDVVIGELGRARNIISGLADTRLVAYEEREIFRQLMAEKGFKV
jgi:CheY-like chemotaxis protein